MQRCCTLGVRNERGSRMNGACFWRALWAGEVCGKCQKGLWILRKDSWPAINREGDAKQGWLSGEDTSTQPWWSIGMHNKERRKSILEEIKSVETWEHETAWCVPGMQHFHMVAAPSQRRGWQVTEARGTKAWGRGPHPNCPSWRSHLLYSRVMTVLCPHTKRMDATWSWGYFVKQGQSFYTQTPALKPKLHINTCPHQASQSMDWERSSEKKNLLMDLVSSTL